MKFKCQRCGNCCKNISINIAWSDFLRWSKEKRFDILSKITYVKTGEGEWDGFYINKTIVKPTADCPFLTKENGLAKCSIEDTKPRACRDAPHAYDADEIEEFNCSAKPYDPLSGRELFLAKRDQALDFKIAEDRKDKAIEILKKVERIGNLINEVREFGKDPTESLWVDSLGTEYTDWTEQGSTPFLDAQDATNYITVAAKKARHGNFGIESSAVGAGTINGVSFYIYSRYTGGASVLDINVYDYGDTAWRPYTVTPDSTPSWKSFSINDNITTWDDIANLIFNVQSENNSETCDIDAVYILIDYVATNTITFDADAILQKVQTIDFDADAILLAEQIITFDCDAILQAAGATYTITFDCDAILILQPTIDFDADAILKATDQTITFDADAILLVEQTIDFDADAILKATDQTIIFDADAILKSENQTIAFDCDAILTAGAGTITFDCDAVLILQPTITFDADAVLILQPTITFDADAILLAEQTIPFDVDAYLKSENQTIAFDADAILLAEQTIDFDADGILIFQPTITFDADAYLKSENETITFDCDAILTADTFIKFYVDAILLAEQTIDFDLDAVLILQPEKTFDVDAVLGGAISFDCDAVLDEAIQYASYGTVFYYNKEQWDDVAFYFESYMKATSGTAYGKLWDLTDNKNVDNSVINSNSPSYSRKRSNRIYFEHDHLYEARFGCEVGDGGAFMGAKVVALGIS
jgi:Fe-S-cluster containining protein